MALCLGCSSPPAATVSGTVLLDEEPLGDAAVQFWPKHDLQLGVYSARTQSDGQFSLRGRDSEHVKPGSYIVLIAREVKKKDGRVPQPDDDPMALAVPGALINTLPAVYFNREKPIFVVEIVPGHNELPPFSLKRRP